MSSTSLRCIGLTGGIGSGKSTLGNMLQECGLPLIDADAISRQLTSTGGAANEPLQEIFGADCIDANGALDRDHMRQLVFSNQDAKHRLQQLLHPLILVQIEQDIQVLANKGNSLVVIDIPLLVESSHWRDRLDRVIVVDCEENTQVDRVVSRSHLSPDAVRQIMVHQASRHQRLAAADIVIYNNDISLDELREQAKQISL